jgi:glutathione synthase/RimK-type ligase-like ATP-grasp enzyme
MNLAIHVRKGSFSDRWVAYCEDQGIPFKVVDCFASDIIQQLQGVDALMWHWHQADPREMLFAKELTQAISNMGVRMFPDVDTCWHYDDKVAQKYLFEALEIPLVPSHVFYSKEEALQWADEVSYPKVFKLRGGAGSVNVQLVRSHAQALRLIGKAFGRGFSSISRTAILGDRIREFKNSKTLGSLFGIVKCLGRFILPSEKERMGSRQVGYAYFQDFIPDNNHDTRLVVVGERCFGLRRYCRKDDFRASGSGEFSYELDFFPSEMIALAFQTAKKLKMQSVAFDFVVLDGQYLLVEVSYCYSMGAAYDNCPGYWDANGEWHESPVDPQRFILEDFLQST